MPKILSSEISDKYKPRIWCTTLVFFHQKPEIRLTFISWSCLFLNLFPEIESRSRFSISCEYFVKVDYVPQCIVSVDTIHWRFMSSRHISLVFFVLYQWILILLQFYHLGQCSLGDLNKTYILSAGHYTLVDFVLKTVLIYEFALF